jgi:hypothetical protein
MSSIAAIATKLKGHFNSNPLLPRIIHGGNIDLEMVPGLNGHQLQGHLVR